MFSKEGDWILDGCVGSGSGMVAAAIFVRNVLSVDIDLRCCQFMVLRINFSDSLFTETEEIGKEFFLDVVKIFKKELMVGMRFGVRGFFYLFQRRKFFDVDG